MRTHTASFKRTAGSLAVLGLLAFAPLAGQTDQVDGTVLHCTLSGAGGYLDVSVNGESATFAFSQSDTAWPSRRYGDLVKQVYAMSSSCPDDGARVRLIVCRKCAPLVVAAIEVGGRGTTFDETKRSLWLYRQYFDYTRPYERDAIFLTSMMLARYDRIDHIKRSLWIRGPLAATLNDYSSRAPAEAMIRQFGEPSLLASVPSLTKVYNSTKDQSGLVRGRPYVPKDPRKSPFIGFWGVFPIEVYTETPQGNLSRMFSASRDQ